MEEERRLLTLRELPPLPEPLHEERRRQCRKGCLVVLLTASATIGLTLVAVFIPEDLPHAASWIFAALLCCEAMLAAFCYAGVALSDPGRLRRSADILTELPESVAERLRRGDSLITDMRNVEVCGRSFCVRCLVWRGKRARGHHCQVCGFCVDDFDHHCDVLGRCIAGKNWWSGDGGWGLRHTGNLLYFQGLISMAIGGLVTFGAALLMVVVHMPEGNAKTTAAITLGVLFLCSCCVRWPRMVVGHGARGAASEAVAKANTASGAADGRARQHKGIRSVEWS